MWSQSHDNFENSLVYRSILKHTLDGMTCATDVGINLCAIYCEWFTLTVLQGRFKSIKLFLVPPWFLSTMSMTCVSIICNTSSVPVQFLNYFDDHFPRLSDCTMWYDTNAVIPPPLPFLWSSDQRVTIASWISFWLSIMIIAFCVPG